MNKILKICVAILIMVMMFCSSVQAKLNIFPQPRYVPELSEFARATKDDGIHVILISPAEEWKSVDEKRLFLKRFGAEDLISYSDKKSTFVNGMGIMVTPTALLINRDGLELGQITGAVPWDNPKAIKYIVDLKNKLY